MRDLITLTLHGFAIGTMVAIAICTDMTTLAQLGIILASATSIYVETQR